MSDRRADETQGEGTGKVGKGQKRHGEKSSHVIPLERVSEEDPSSSVFVPEVYGTYASTDETMAEQRGHDPDMGVFVDPVFILGES